MLVALALMALGVLGNSYLHPLGNVSPDSAHYLKAAAKLRCCGSFEALPDPSQPDNQGFFATWPLGYPLLIATTGLLTGLDVFWAAKLLAVLCVAVMAWTLHRRFRPYGLAYAALLCHADLLVVYETTWSEVPFFLFSLLFALRLADYRRVRRSGDAVWLGALCLAMFLTRYIGAFGWLVIGFFFLSDGLLRRRWDFRLLLAGLVSGLAGLAYLWNNYRLTGHWTGISRGPARDTLGELLGHLGHTLLSFAHFLYSSKDWLNYRYVITAAVLVLVVVFFYRMRKRFPTAAGESPPSVVVWPEMGITALVFLLSMSVLRFFFWMNTLDVRLLSPLLPLVLVGGLNLVDSRGRLAPWMRQGLVALAFAGLLINTLGKQTYLHFRLPDRACYPETVAGLERKYRGLFDQETQAVILYGENHLRYLKPRYTVLNSYGWFTLPLDSALRRAAQYTGPVYVSVTPPEEIIYGTCHPSVARFYRRHRDRSFVSLEEVLHGKRAAFGK